VVLNSHGPGVAADYSGSRAVGGGIPDQAARVGGGAREDPPWRPRSEVRRPTRVARSTSGPRSPGPHHPSSSCAGRPLPPTSV